MPNKYKVHKKHVIRPEYDDFYEDNLYDEDYDIEGQDRRFRERERDDYRDRSDSSDLDRDSDKRKNKERDNEIDNFEDENEEFEALIQQMTEWINEDDHPQSGGSDSKKKK